MVLRDGIRINGTPYSPDGTGFSEFVKNSKEKRKKERLEQLLVSAKTPIEIAYAAKEYLEFMMENGDKRPEIAMLCAKFDSIFMDLHVGIIPIIGGAASVLSLAEAIANFGNNTHGMELTQRFSSLDLEQIWGSLVDFFSALANPEVILPALISVFFALLVAKFGQDFRNDPSKFIRAESCLNQRDIQLILNSKLLSEDQIASLGRFAGAQEPEITPS